MEGAILVLLVLLHLFNPSVSLMNRSVSPEDRLINDLLNGYNPIVRPKSATNESVRVLVGFELRTLISMDEKQQTVSIVGWFYLNWGDERLVWDPSLYGAIDTVLLPQERMWLPDAWLLNGVDKLFYDLNRFLSIVHHNGSILFMPGGEVVLSCNFNLMYFPFDTQACMLKVNSWSTTDDKMMLQADRLYTSIPIENCEWRLIDTFSYRESKVYPGGNYSEVTFMILLKRKSLYQLVNVIIPIVTLPFLNLAVFHLPAESGEKVSLSITVLLAYSMWLLMMSSITPTSSDNMPIVAICTMIFIVLSTIAVIIAVAVVHLHHKDDSSNIPLWVRKLLQWYRRRRGDNVRATDAECSDSEKFTWRDMAAAVDSIMYYAFLAVIILVIVVAAGLITAGAPAQLSAFKQLHI